MFCVKIVNVDFYMSNPIDGLDVRYSEFRSASVNYVPVIRIFGSSHTGKKTCLHVHGVFPYMYIPFDGSDSASAVSYQVASNLDKALNISLGQANSNAQHIYKVTLVSGKPLYGYHAKEHQFLKISFYNPLMIKRACTILQNGSILGKIFQPHETHVPYILQFMIDYNLHGMSFITLSKVLFRLDSQTAVDPSNFDQYLPSNVTKLSICEVEADALAEHILNRLEVAGGNIGSNPGIACIWEDEKQRRRDKNLDSQISQCISQTKRKFTTTASHVTFKQTLKLKLSEAPKSIEELDKDKLDPNASVYPIETPSGESLLNASQVDLRTPNDSQCSFDASFNDSFTSNSNDNDATSNSSALFDTDAKNLLDVLCNLREKAEIEEDSILSQSVRKEDDSESDEETKLSAPLAVTPVKDLEVKIPQLDGNSDSGPNFFSLGSAVRINTLDNITPPPVMYYRSTKRKNSEQNSDVNGNKRNMSLRNTQAKDTAAVEQKRNSEIITCQDAIKSLSIKIPQLDGNADSGVHLNNENTEKTNVDLDKLTAPPISPPKIKRKSTKRKDKNDYSSNKFLLAQSELDETVIAALEQKRITRSVARKFNLAVCEHSSALYKEHKRKKNRIKAEMPVVESIYGAPKRGLDMPDISSIHDHDEHTKCNITELKTEDIKEEIPVKNCFKKHFPKCYTAKFNTEDIREVLVKKCFFKKHPANFRKEVVVDIVHPQKRKNVRRKTLEKKVDIVQLAAQIKKDRKLQLIKNGLRVRFKLLCANRPHDHIRNGSIQVSCPTLDYSFTCDTANPTPYLLPKPHTQKRYNCASHYCNDNVCKEALGKWNEILKAQEIIEKRFWKLAKQYMANSNISGLVILRESEKEKGESEKTNDIKDVSDTSESREFTHERFEIKQSEATFKSALPIEMDAVKKSDINNASEPFKKSKISKDLRKVTQGKERNDQNPYSGDFKTDAYSKVINKQLLCLDGANDSSSSEEEDIEHVGIFLKQAALYKKESLSYCPLTVHVESNKKHSIIESLDGANDKPSSTKKRESKRKKVTRRLNFESKSLIPTNTENKETDEDELVCSYKHKAKRESIVTVIPKSNTHSQIDAINLLGTPNENIEDTDVISSLSSKELFSSETEDLSAAMETTLCENNVDKYDLFSSETEDLSAAIETTLCENNVDKYDSEIGYKPKPGFSKNITQSTCEPSPDQNTSLDSLTPYQKCNLTQNLTVYAPKFETKELSSEGLCVWVPQFNPPTKNSVKESLAKYNIPEVRHEEPFYSDPSDVKGKIEIGRNVLRIISKSSIHAPEFQSNFQGIQKQIELNMPSEFVSDRSENIKAAKARFFGDDKYVVVTPVKLPPTAKEVRMWLKNASVLAAVEKPAKKEKQKIYLPCSPTNALDSSNESLSLSPLTPEKNNFDNSEIDQDVTITEKTSPILKSKIKKRKRSKRNKSRDSNIAPNVSHARERLLKTVVNTQFLNQLNTSSDHSGAITGATMNNTFGFKMSLENLQNVKAVMEHQYLTILILELHIQTRGDLKPNPELDPIRAVFYNIVNDAPDVDKQIQGVFVVNTLNGQQCPEKQSILDGTGITCPITFVNSELDLINDLVKFVHFWNPDVFMGYEIEMLSWGYLIQRGYNLGINLLTQFSRIPSQKPMKSDDQTDPTSELILSGRIVIDMWRLMRHEIALQSYTFESIAFHVLHERVPQYSFKSLSFWWEHSNALNRHKTADYYLYRVKGIARILDQLDLIGRTSELARLFGIQFYEVLSRGSQFRVESMMLRLAKPMNYIPVSPSVQQRAKMRAPEFLPLILEPESKFYADPIIVLDFQSLYPSIIIAYNYCFSTCIGRVEHLGKNVPFQFGATQLKIPKKILKKLLVKNCLNFSPCGAGFVKPSVHPGILPKMLKEILDTRLMVKKSMKQNSDNKTLYRVLHSRQLGLKLIANVTYGYTAANFSGRMPCVEVADSVVSKGRETLQRAIDLVEKTTEWGARVVYGDTDSLFVLVPGKSREDAFKIGAKIADAVTMDNPSPVKLKLEKVYQPCILQTKKRYVGYMYESPEQKEASFDAKGIETVRRDGCPAGAKILEKCLKMLFDHCDVSLIRKYVLRQFNKIFLGRISIQELTFAKEYRGASGYRPGACVPALELIRKWKSVDKRNEPRPSERVPYVIVNGPPGVPLIKLVRSPYELLADPSLRPNALYYITKVIIPPLNRCFMLIGADINTWFNEMPRRQFQSLPVPSPAKKSIISHFFSTTSCIVCTQQTQDGICYNCKNESQTSVVMLQDKLQLWQRHIAEINLICKSCGGQSAVPPCISLDCPVLYQRTKADLDIQQVPYINQIMNSCFDG